MSQKNPIRKLTDMSSHRNVTPHFGLDELYRSKALGSETHQEVADET
ncbi:MAG: hypothetical protein ACXACE_03400 [Candidatus Thorarchaeota archaeon]